MSKEGGGKASRMEIRNFKFMKYAESDTDTDTNETTDKDMQSIGVEETGSTRPWSECFDWERMGDDTGLAEPRTRELCDEWGVESMRGECGGRAVMCVERAARHVREWERKRKDRARRPPRRLLRRILHIPGVDEVLPASVSKESDQYYLPFQRRYATAGEVAATLEVEGPYGGDELRAALDGGVPQVSQQAARRMLGGAVHVGMTAAVVRKGLQAMGGVSGAVRYMDVCSGVGTVAVAVGRASGARVEYVEAAEKQAAARAVLREAWGEGLRIYKDATGREMREAPAHEVDVAAVTAPCGVWSKLNASRNKAAKRTEAKKMWRTIMKRVAERRPRMILVESVAELSGRDAKAGRELEEIMQEAADGYEWRMQALSAQVHGGGVSVRRDRAYWVALRDGWGEGERTAKE